MKNKILKICNLISIAVLAVLLGLFVLFGAVNTTAVYANNTDEVLRDLQRDNTFNKDEYPYKPEAIDLQVITVAEGDGEQLFVYVYNPSMNSLYNATYIRLSSTIGENYAPQDYGLTLVSSSGVFQKYFVKNFAVKPYSQRYYDISCIFRKFVKDVDRDCETESKNNVEQVSFEVATCFTATTLNGNVSYSKEYVDVVTITDKYCFNGIYPDGFDWYGLWLTDYETTSHNIAFSTDWDISELFQIDVEYYTQNYTIEYMESVSGKVIGDKTLTLGEMSAEPVVTTIYAKDENGNDITVTNNKDKGWLFGYEFTWKRVQTASSFVEYASNSKDFKSVGDYELSNISNKQWVVAFAETAYTKTSVPFFFLDSACDKVTEKGVKVSNVSIMRLNFKCQGETYNLGVVDNYQTGSIDPIFEGKDGLEHTVDRIMELLEKIFAIVLFIILVVIIVFILNAVSPISGILKYIFKGIKLVISLPFKVIKWVFKIGKKKDG